MAHYLFTKEELEELSIPYPDLIIRKIGSREYDKARSLSREMAESRVVLHDFFADSCVVLWSWIGEQMGEEVMEDMFRYVFEHSVRRQLFKISVLFQVYPRFAISFLAEAGWRSHSCFGTGEYPARFSITEDEEKFTFHLHPCASGERLRRKGWYEPMRGGKLAEGAYGFTHNHKDFPYYCMHCPFHNEILPYETLGHLMWPLDEPQGPDHECRWHIYKDVNAIPKRYYDTLGLEKLKVPSLRAKRWRKRYFTEEELREMARPVTDRIIENLEKGDAKEAIRLCRDVKDEFLFLHDLYVHMLVTTFTFISERRGEDALEEALHVQFQKCIREQLVERIKVLSPPEKIRFLARKIFGPDRCDGTGVPKGRFTVSESDKYIEFVLHPCGSGGRLLKGGGYEPMTGFKRWREVVEDALVINLCKSLPLPDSVLKFAFSLTGGSVTRRKPYAQGRTKKAYPWSFESRDIPYYCCQCGMLQTEVGSSCLKIYPPKGKHAPCIWQLDKDRLI
ncbi:MAG: hypothetical protein JW743_01730 [Deltaproteobacteria bacterium]|nr:hypothetical protein [Deltaproteobacteria bacterium]